MSYKAELTKTAEKQLANIVKSNKRVGFKIQLFLDENLTNDENPCSLPNARKLENSNDNRWRWRINDYRIIGIVGENGSPIIINIIKIAHRQEAYKK